LGDTASKSAADAASILAETGVRLVPVRRATMRPHAWVMDDIEVRAYRHPIETVNRHLETMGIERRYARPNAEFERKVHATLIALICTNMNEQSRWDYEGCLIHTYEGHTERIWSIASTPDGQLLAAVGADKKTILWQPGKSKKQELLLQDIPTACALSPDGRWLIIGFLSGKLEWRTLPNFTEMDFKPSQR